MSAVCLHCCDFSDVREDYDWIVLLLKVVHLFSSVNISAHSKQQHPSMALVGKIASAREILRSIWRDVNTVIVPWTEGRGHLSNNSLGRHCAEGGLIMERDDIEAGRKRVV